MQTAKVFKNGRSQAVRIPKQFRFNTPSVTIRRQGNSIVLTPCDEVSWDDFFEHHSCPDFDLDRGESQKIQDRDLF